MLLCLKIITHFLIVTIFEIVTVFLEQLTLRLIRRHYFFLKFQNNRLFSKHLPKFEDICENNLPNSEHRNGDILTFNGRLTAMGGYLTRRVDLYIGEVWKSGTIPPIGNTDGNLQQFSSLATKSYLFVFGKISVYYNISKLK